MQKSRENKIILVVIIACVLLVCGIFIWLINTFGSKKVEDSFMGFRKGDFTVVEENDTHGGFHGDGTYLLVLDCSKKKELAMELVKGWKEFPLSENLNTVLYGSSTRGALLLKEEGSIPIIMNGYYYFCDRNSESTDSGDDTDLLSRNSYNFTLAIYDSDTNRFYYMEFDT